MNLKVKEKRFFDRHFTTYTLPPLIIRYIGVNIHLQKLSIEWWMHIHLWLQKLRPSQIIRDVIVAFVIWMYSDHKNTHLICTRKHRRLLWHESLLSQSREPYRHVPLHMRRVPSPWYRHRKNILAQRKRTEREWENKKTRRAAWVNIFPARFTRYNRPWAIGQLGCTHRFYRRQVCQHICYYTSHLSNRAHFKHSLFFFFFRFTANEKISDEII